MRLRSVAAGAVRECAPAALIGRLYAAPRYPCHTYPFQRFKLGASLAIIQQRRWILRRPHAVSGPMALRLAA